MMKPKTRVAIFMPVELRDKIKKIADKNKRKMVQQIEWWADEDLLATQPSNTKL